MKAKISNASYDSMAFEDKTMETSSGEAPLSFKQAYEAASGTRQANEIEAPSSQPGSLSLFDFLLT